MPDNLPAFSDLPLNPDDPPHSAWGLYGRDDQLGTLNRLTDEVVLEAAKEIQTGVRVSLDLPLNVQKDVPVFERLPFELQIIEKKPRCVNDDIWKLNSQSSSQWDGLRHYAYQKERRFYNNVTMEQIHSAGDETYVNGVQNMTKRGIVGRGILLDYHTWQLKNGIQYNCFGPDPIKLDHLKACAKDQDTEIKFGDILLVRTGYTEAYSALEPEQVKTMVRASVPSFAGVEQSEAVLEWIWDNFSAVAGDQLAFEHIPPANGQLLLHQVLLAGWGCPIGELFDLEELAKTCQRLGRYSFFVTSKVNNVPGGVASPPNMLAIF